MQALNLKINHIFDKTGQNNPCQFEFTHLETSKLQDLCKLLIMTSY